MSTHCSCHCLVTTSTEYYVTSSCQNESRTHARKWSTMAKESSERGVLKEKCVDHNRKRIENLSQANAVKEKVIHLDQLEFISNLSLLRTFDLDAASTKCDRSFLL